MHCALSAAVLIAQPNGLKGGSIAAPSPETAWCSSCSRLGLQASSSCTVSKHTASSANPSWRREHLTMARLLCIAVAAVCLQCASAISWPSLVRSLATERLYGCTCTAGSLATFSDLQQGLTSSHAAWHHANCYLDLESWCRHCSSQPADDKAQWTRPPRATSLGEQSGAMFA